MLNLRPLDPARPIGMKEQPAFLWTRLHRAICASSAVAQPHLFAKVAVPKLCAA